MPEQVCAVVVTYNRMALLQECLRALQAQSRPVDKIVVVNNAGTDATLQMLEEHFPGVEVLTLPKNVGGAGGFHAGIEWAYKHEQAYRWIWLMDDDGRPAPDCLERLLACERPDSVLVPLQQDSRGRFYGVSVWRGRHIDVTSNVAAKRTAVSGPFLFAFVGPLISRTIVEQIGLPNKDFFIWFDDFEYCLRINAMPGADIVAVPDAIFFHDFGENAHEVRFLGRRSIRSYQPAWKLYYGARNPLYILMRQRRNLKEVLLHSLVQSRLLLMDVVYESDRWERVKMRSLGMRDGAMGRLGKRV